MNLKSMTNEKLIVLDFYATSKNDVIEKLVDALYENDIITSKNDFLQAVLEREKQSPTGLEDGVAIPHGKSSAVKKSAFAVARLKNKITDWESINEKNEVDMVFLLAIPEQEASTKHLKLLSQLSTALMDKNFLHNLKLAKNKSQFIEALNYNKNKHEISNSDKIVLAITSCATGIAHTYMAAEALEKAGQEMGVKILVEKQGANGIENPHTNDIIQKADAIIFATDIYPKSIERFNGKPYIMSNVTEPLKNAKELINKALNKPDGILNKNDEILVSENSSEIGIVNQLSKAVLTGISYMIPVIVAAGIMIGIAKIGAMGFGIVQEIGNSKYATNPNEIIRILHYLDRFGGLIFAFMYPIFSAFVAYAIADRVGLVSGFLGGVFAAGLHYTHWGIKDGIPSGFLGALILGIAAGYISKFLNEKIKLRKSLSAMKPMLIIPGVSVLSIFLLNFYIVDPVFGGLNEILKNLILSSREVGTITLSSIIAAATAFDLGGPVNKAAGAIAIGLAADRIFPLTPRVLSIVIPPIGLGLATILDKFLVGRKVFDEDLRVAGRTSILLGFIAISEGAIPFMLKNPLITIPINIIGAILGSVTAVLLGAVQWYPLPAIWGWPLVENLWAYIIGLLVGTLFIALSNIFIRFRILKRKSRY
ncbi:fructose-specific PTS transporter subunit EIIC [Anaerobranca gottschalkii]|uniref:PTS system IIA component, Fru family /PTS system IIB component, Fru family /PTS system IIC component, Fru family n=1 Tax=Anaerobranca gottschalkii DSM 13577 TaxID=1120990 RepID=A0A1I0CC13_9FIRM|nr:fructose-specific PTS transporter subunit EIIC [Anaerobranca gottschalkii]SET16803.1 PTS system IIA component, Fru family /PTS system IIB component, Fru family /PTS system IIC component, Fru family [Anaerobranca gottschalkii DSM 13577]